MKSAHADTAASAESATTPAPVITAWPPVAGSDDNPPRATSDGHRSPPRVVTSPAIAPRFRFGAGVMGVYLSPFIAGGYLNLGVQLFGRLGIYAQPALGGFYLGWGVGMGLFVDYAATDWLLLGAGVSGGYANSSFWWGTEDIIVGFPVRVALMTRPDLPGARRHAFTFFVQGGPNMLSRDGRGFNASGTVSAGIGYETF